MSKPSLPTSKEEKARAYLQVLFEISARLDLIQSTKSMDLPYGISREICYLQLRHICELTAVGCLVIQGDYTSSSDFVNEYSPSKIFRALEKLYEGFFPQPATMTTEGGLCRVQCHSGPNSMTRKQMETLWGKTGNYLHRLKIKNFFKIDTPGDAKIWPEIDNAVQQITSLLEMHVVAMHKPKILVVARLAGDHGAPCLSFLEYGDNGTMQAHDFVGQGETPYWRHQ